MCGLLCKQYAMMSFKDVKSLLNSVVSFHCIKINHIYLILRLI
jgi:hypothetical protein